jgi:hypothetical protein
VKQVEDAMVAWLTARAAQAEDAHAAFHEIHNCVRQAGHLLKGKLNGVMAPTLKLLKGLEAKMRLDVMFAAVKALRVGMNICEDFSLITDATEAPRSQPAHSRL